MEYMMLLAAAPDAWERNDPGADDEVIDDWGAYTRALGEAGILLGGHGLQGEDTATTVRLEGGRPLVTDGPYATVKEHLIGYYLLDAPDLDTVIEWAARAPHARIGSVEIRPVIPGSATRDMLEGGAGPA